MTRVTATVELDSGVSIGECVLDSDVDIALGEAETLLDQGERARAAGFVFTHDRDAFVRSHGYLRKQLGAFLQVAPGKVPIIAEDGKKPFVLGHEVDFSLSHSGSHAVVAISRGGEIGIDLEVLDKAVPLGDELDGLASMVLTDEEQHAIAAAAPEHRVRLFLSYWTAKEARMKLTGEGMSLEPHTISLALSDGEPVGYLRPVAPSADLQFIALSRQDSVCCLAIRRAA